MVQKYIGLSHQYGVIDCIELIRTFYKNELDLSFDLPSYPKSAQWMKQFSCTNVDSWASTYGVKVSLTDAKNYDVMVFRSLKSDLVTHFGLYIQHNKILHVEEGRDSCVESLSEYWRDRLYTIYRHNEMV
jgi:cell wall-associated NlpC family hydrolase